MINTKTVSTKNFFEKSFKKIALSADRRNLLLDLSSSIAKVYAKNEVVHLNFICTHNSRRSQLAQIWGFYAAHYFNLNIKSFSGGTEITAFYRNTVKTLQKAGFSFNLKEFNHQNPKYEIAHNDSKRTILGYSKLYNDIHNLEPYYAITTCNNADKNCPYIPEAQERFHLPFVDPKHSDGTEKQEEVYLQTNKQVAGEIFFVFSNIKKLLS